MTLTVPSLGPVGLNDTDLESEVGVFAPTGGTPPYTILTVSGGRLALLEAVEDFVADTVSIAAEVKISANLSVVEDFAGDVAAVSAEVVISAALAAVEDFPADAVSLAISNAAAFATSVGSAGLGTWRVNKTTGEVYFDPGTPGGWAEGITESRATIFVRDALGTPGLIKGLVNVTKNTVVNPAVAFAAAMSGTLVRYFCVRTPGGAYQNLAATIPATEPGHPVAALRDWHSNTVVMLAMDENSLPVLMELGGALALSCLGVHGGMIDAGFAWNSNTQIGNFAADLRWEANAAVTTGFISIGGGVSVPGGIDAYAFAGQPTDERRIRIGGPSGTLRAERFTTGMQGNWRRRVVVSARRNATTGDLRWWQDNVELPGTTTSSTHNATGNLANGDLRILGSFPGVFSRLIIAQDSFTGQVAAMDAEVAW